ncbi:uncharacterized protein LOC144646429 [Oculina patagonica]
MSTGTTARYYAHSQRIPIKSYRNMEEPSAKRPRSATEEPHDEHSYIYIRLKKENYDEWVRNLSHEQLVSVFDLGVKVKESVVFTVDVNQKFMEKALSSQMQPVQETVANIEKEVQQQVKAVQENVSKNVGEQMKKMSEDVQGFKGDLTKDIKETLAPSVGQIQGTMDKIERKVNDQVLKVQENVTESVCGHMKKMADNVLDFKKEMSENIKSIGNKLEEDVKSVTAKVPPLDSVKTEIKDSENRITEALEKQKVQLDAISATLANPSKKGARAEKNVLDILNESLRSSSFTFRNTSAERGRGDIEAESPDGHKIMIEVKKWSASLSKEAVESFENNLAKSPDLKVGILLSMSSGIARRSKGSKFEIAFSQDQKQYQIYVPNAYVNNEEHPIVWSVVVAAELAKIEGGDLGEKKTQELKKIYTQFQANVQYSQNCRTSLTALVNSVQSLKANIVPILDTVDNTKKDIYKLLHPS